ncbi:hypothetical protein ACFO4O_05365 [Glaciecola siphonariae]|uniref:Uncharacterized protein n=1 Tax=Glaciecola siphonariae TaxID=521012 RepID=A0ABV9LUG6_9ALTE
MDKVLHIAFLCCLSLLTVSIKAHAKQAFTPSEYACNGIDKKIENINSSMRKGYTASQGERYREALRTLKKKRFSCKKKGYSVK